MLHRFQSSQTLAKYFFPGSMLNFFFTDENQIIRSPQQMLMRSVESPHPSLHSVSHHGIPNFLAGDYRHPGKMQLIGKIDEDEISSSKAGAFLVYMKKIFPFS